MSDTSLVPANVILGENFSEAETEILKGILDDEDSAVELTIPEDIDPDKLWAALEVACKINNTIKRAADRIKPIIGRMLNVIKDYPALYQDRGFRTYDDFMTNGVPKLFSMDRGEAYRLAQVNTLFPGLSIGEFKQIGVAKLYAILPAAREAQNPKQKEKLLDAAKTMKVETLKEHVAKLRGQQPDDIKCEVVQIFCSKTIKDQWLKFKHSPLIVAYVGSETDAEIFAAMMQEAATEWTSQMAEQARTA